MHLVYCLLTRLWCQVHTQRRHHVLIGIFIKLSHQKIIILHSQRKFLHIYKTKIICLLTSISRLNKVLDVHFWFESLWKQTGGVTLGKHSDSIVIQFTKVSQYMDLGELGGGGSWHEMDYCPTLHWGSDSPNMLHGTEIKVQKQTADFFNLKYGRK